MNNRDVIEMFNKVADMLAMSKDAGKDGRHERFKTTTGFDSGYHRRQHGL